MATGIAIVGMAGRFPEAPTVSAMWQLLLDGREAVRRIDVEELRTAGVADKLIFDPAYMPYGAQLSSVEKFDAAFFGMTPAEATSADPQHRLFMECAFRALEDGGIPAEGRIGVFASTGQPHYLVRHLIPAGNHIWPDLPYSVRLGNQIDFLASRVCYALDLKGPAVSLQTACSSSLVGVDAACTALMMQRCDVALAGAMALRLPQAGYLYSEGSAWSRDGHCRPFDAAASGWVAGSGGAVIVLKRLADAVADRDRIYAVIRGIGINNDGADKISYSAPSTSGQIGAVTQALAVSGVAAHDIGYVEAHGSGTKLGDGIEVDALCKAYGTAGGVAPGCGLGSIKANVGHLDTAAGIAGLVKAALVLKHQVIPPQINFERPNTLLKLEHGGFTVYSRAYSPSAPIRAAAVSSLGMGGTNVHMILAAHTQNEEDRTAPGDGRYRLPLSARNKKDLRTLAQDLDRYLGANSVRIDDLAYTLTHGRSRMRESIAIHAGSIAEARNALRNYLDGHLPASGRVTDIQGDMRDAVKIPLPGYPLHLVPHWIDPPQQRSASEEPDAAADIRPESSDLLQEVISIFRSYLGIAELGPDDDYEQAGGSSMTAVEIVDAIAERLGPTMGLGRFYQLRTPRKITEEIRTWPGGNMIDPVILQLREGTAGEEIFFIHPANGTVSCYQKLAMHTRFSHPVYAISYPFADKNPLNSISEMAARYVALIKDVSPSGPYRLAGYSLGGNIAVEIAAQLRKAGDKVKDIVIVDALPIEAYPRGAAEADYLRVCAIAVSYLLGLPIPSGRADSVDGVLAILRQPTWSRRTEETMRRFVDMFVRSGMALSTAVRPDPIDADLTIIAATDQRNPVFDEVGIADLPLDAWQRYTNGKLTSITIPGNHYTLYSDPKNFAQLATLFDRIYGDTDKPA